MRGVPEKRPVCVGLEASAVGVLFSVSPERGCQESVYAESDSWQVVAIDG